MDGKRVWIRQADPETVVPDPSFEGTVRRGSATCPCCGYTTPVASVRRQLKERHGGAADARLFTVVVTHPDEPGRFYRLPVQADLDAITAAVDELERRQQAHVGRLSLVPDERISLNEIRRISVPLYGMVTWGDLFTPRQALVLAALSEGTRSLACALPHADRNLRAAIETVLALAVSRYSDILNALCMWENTKTQVRHLLTRQAISMVWDFAEPHIYGDAAGDYLVTLDTMVDVLGRSATVRHQGQAERASATAHPLPDDVAQAVVTDPPYYDAVPYSHLSDFFYVWLRRSLAQAHAGLFGDPVAPKDAEIVVDRPHELSTSKKGVAFYEGELSKAFVESRRVLRPDGAAVIVFASKTTASWEAVLQAVVDAGWTVTGSWPIDTEMTTRVAAQGQARLASSVHLVCRPREDPDGSLRQDSVGDWREVLQELPQRIHEWMPRLASEGVVGADAIFACLGPALEVFSRHSRVEKASGEEVTLRLYLEAVWAAVAKEALNLVLDGADAQGFEEDARLTAIWFWVLRTSSDNGNGSERSDDQGDSADEDEDQGDEPAATSKFDGFAIEFDAARLLAQGLGADLGRLSQPGGILAIKGNVAVLLGVSDREPRLLGRQLSLFGGSEQPRPRRRHSGEATAIMGSVARQARQQSLGFHAGDHTPRPDDQQPVLPGMEAPTDERSLMERILANGVTTLDRLHQTMLLFGRGSTALLAPFLERSGIAQDERFWRLAQALSGLYPANTEEKRWVDGVLARKKGLGF